MRSIIFWGISNSVGSTKAAKTHHLRREAVEGREECHLPCPDRNSNPCSVECTPRDHRCQPVNREKIEQVRQESRDKVKP